MLPGFGGSDTGLRGKSRISDNSGNGDTHTRSGCEGEGTLARGPEVKFKCRSKLVKKALVASLALLWGMSFLEEMLARHLEHAERVFSLCRAASR